MRHFVAGTRALRLAQTTWDARREFPIEIRPIGVEAADGPAARFDQDTADRLYLRPLAN